MFPDILTGYPCCEELESHQGGLLFPEHLLCAKCCVSVILLKAHKEPMGLSFNQLFTEKCLLSRDLRRRDC